MDKKTGNFSATLNAVSNAESCALDVLGAGVPGLLAFLGLEPADDVSGLKPRRWSDHFGGGVEISLRETLSSQIPGMPLSYKVVVTVENSRWKDRDVFSVYRDRNSFIFVQNPDRSLHLHAATLSYLGIRCKEKSISPSFERQIINMLALSADCCRLAPCASVNEHDLLKQQLNSLPQELLGQKIFGIAPEGQSAPRPRDP